MKPALYRGQPHDFSKPPNCWICVYTWTSCIHCSVKVACSIWIRGRFSCSQQRIQIHCSVILRILSDASLVSVYGSKSMLHFYCLRLHLYILSIFKMFANLDYLLNIVLCTAELSQFHVCHLILSLQKLSYKLYIFEIPCTKRKAWSWYLTPLHSVCCHLLQEWLNFSYLYTDTCSKRWYHWGRESKVNDTCGGQGEGAG